MPRVLLLEASEWSRRVIQVSLHPEYQVILLGDPEEAVRICYSERPDLLIADVFLADPISGIEMIWRVHAMSPQLPILLVSATPMDYWQDGDVTRLFRLRQTARIAYLPKPFTAQTLRSTVKDLMNGREDFRCVAWTEAIGLI